MPPRLWSSGYGHGNAVVQRSERIGHFVSCYVAIPALILDSGRCCSSHVALTLLGYFKVDGKINRKEALETLKLRDDDERRFRMRAALLSL
jgi:hypothetical protein